MTQVRKQSTANRTLTIHCFFDSPLIIADSKLCWAEIDFNFMVAHGWPQNHRFFLTKIQAQKRGLKNSKY